MEINTSHRDEEPFNFPLSSSILNVPVWGSILDEFVWEYDAGYGYDCTLRSILQAITYMSFNVTSVLCLVCLCYACSTK